MSSVELAVAAVAPLGTPAPVPPPAPRPEQLPPLRPQPRPDTSRLLAQLHERHGAELLRLCRWMLKDPDDAADALQDTWIRAMSALDGSLRVATLRPWLFSIARNVCIDRLRDRKRHSLHDLDADAMGQTPGADEVVAMRHDAHAALALVGSLSERQRQALLMREVAGMSVPEIASALRLSPERAAWTITDARRALTEARAGTSVDCADARARLDAGHRGRRLRSHLQSCAECRSYDRRLRARRVLAPALLPLLWLRRAGWPTLLKPVAAATVAAIGATQLPAAPDSARAEPRVARHAPAAPRAKTPVPAARSHSDRMRPGVRHAPRRMTAARQIVSAPRPPAAAAPAAAAASRAPARFVPAAAPPDPLQRVLTAAHRGVAQTAEAVQRATAPVRTTAAPVTAAAQPVAEAVAATVEVLG